MIGGCRDKRHDSFQCQNFLLAHREYSSRCRASIGYTFGNLMSFERVETLTSHTGCVNTLKWSKDGTKLISGSDDRTVKIWSHNQSSKGSLLKHTIRTGHRSNIFCADFSPINESMIVSCAADGTLYKNDLNSLNAEVRLMKSEGLMHMFIFDVEQPQTIYTAEDIGRGIISRIDLRSNKVETLFSTDYLKQCSILDGTGPASGQMSSVKALAQNDVLGGSQLLIGGGRSFSLGLLDIRCLTAVPTGTDFEAELEGSQFVRIWEPQKHHHLNSGFKKHRRHCGVSVSGLSFSQNGASILASYQGDQIYIFDTYDNNSRNTFKECHKDEEHSVIPGNKAEESSSSSSNNVSRIGPRNMLGGHINHATFLKAVSFFGPKDEYVVSGSDSGHLWVWDATSGDLDLEDPHDRTCRVINFLKADDSTCNGVVPHPYAPILASYGIASDVKIWACENPFPMELKRSEAQGGRPFLPRSSTMNRYAEEEMKYQGRGRDGHYKKERSQHCDMDKLHCFLKLQRASISSRDESSPLVSDINQYEITTRAIRTDSVTSGSAGDNLHLPKEFQLQSSRIGPDYPADLMTYSCRKNWKNLMSECEKKQVEELVYELYITASRQLDEEVETERKEHEQNAMFIEREKKLCGKSFKTITPATNRYSGISDPGSAHELKFESESETNNKNQKSNAHIYDEKISLYEEMDSMTHDQMWDEMKIVNTDFIKKDKFDYFPTSLVLYSEIYRIGNAIKKLGNEAFRNKQYGCARILYEKALRYGDQSTLRLRQSLNSFEGSCVLPEKSEGDMSGNCMGHGNGAGAGNCVFSNEESESVMEDEESNEDGDYDEDDYDDYDDDEEEEEMEEVEEEEEEQVDEEEEEMEEVEEEEEEEFIDNDGDDDLIVEDNDDEDIDLSYHGRDAQEREVRENDEEEEEGEEEEEERDERNIMDGKAIGDESDEGDRDANNKMRMQQNGDDNHSVDDNDINDNSSTHLSSTKTEAHEVQMNYCSTKKTNWGGGKYVRGNRDAIGVDNYTDKNRGEDSKGERKKIRDGDVPQTSNPNIQNDNSWLVGYGIQQVHEPSGKIENNNKNTKIMNETTDSTWCNKIEVGVENECVGSLEMRTNLGKESGSASSYSGHTVRASDSNSKILVPISPSPVPQPTPKKIPNSHLFLSSDGVVTPKERSLNVSEYSFNASATSDVFHHDINVPKFDCWDKIKMDCSTTKMDEKEMEEKDFRWDSNDKDLSMKRQEDKEREVVQHITTVVQYHVKSVFMSELSLTCLSNLIATDIQEEDYVRGKKCFERSQAFIQKASIVPNDVHAKLLFRGACCLYPLGENTAAMTALLEAQKLAPNDKSIQKKLREFKSAEEAIFKSEKRKYAKMFSL